MGFLEAIGWLSAVVSVSGVLFLVWITIIGVPWETHERIKPKHKKGKKNG